ncbi:MAG: type II toxin-antitoxin system RelE/ParE family toxin [Rhizobiales bacterium]|nr:type II toxin-antitoxin system RelE/ParE family toxin [Hyphomicrobiales bacterium]
MRISLTEEAANDLVELRAYLGPLSPEGLHNVVARIEAKIAGLTDQPNSGRPTPREGIREAIEEKYGFVIPYTIIGKTLYVLRVYRSTRRPLDYDGLNTP